MERTATCFLCMALVMFQAGCGTSGQNPGSGPTPTNTSNLTLQFTDSCTNNVELKFYDQTNGDVWPSGSTHWVLNDGNTLSQTVSCQTGDNICFGAAVNGDNSQGYWGAGFGGQLGCTGCCYSCANSSPTGWNLQCSENQNRRSTRREGRDPLEGVEVREFKDSLSRQSIN